VADTEPANVTVSHEGARVDVVVWRRPHYVGYPTGLRIMAAHLGWGGIVQPEFGVLSAKLAEWRVSRDPRK
jgi:hypothetical protein